MNENEEMNQNLEPGFDLWPNYLERKYIDENEEIPLPDNKYNNKEFNPLDFIGNKDENKYGVNNEEENEDDEEDNFNEGYNNYHNINNEDEE